MREFFSAWSFDLFIVINLVVMPVLYMWGVRRVRKMSPQRGWPAGATWAFMCGWACLCIAYLGPLAAWSHTFFWVHMTQHLIVMMAAAPLLVLGLPVTLWVRASSPRARRAYVLPIMRSRGVRFFTDPIVTWLLFAGVLVFTHFTPFFDWALRSHDADVFVEKPLFLIASILFYLPMIGNNMLPRQIAPSHRLASMSIMMVPEAVVGAVIYFSPVVLYSVFAEAQRTFGPDPKADQQLAGALMWALVMVIEAGWMMLIAVEWFTSEERKARKLDEEHSPDIVVS